MPKVWWMRSMDFAKVLRLTRPRSSVFSKLHKNWVLPVKLHAEQLSNLGGAKLAASYGALSADHIEYLDAEGVKAMAQAGTVGVLLPGAFYTLHETQQPPLDLIREHGVPMALATDCNPGSSPLTSLLLTMNMGCTLFRMTPHEALAGVTCYAARALGLDDTGEIAAGMRADLAIWMYPTRGAVLPNWLQSPVQTFISEVWNDAFAPCPGTGLAGAA